MSSELLTKLGIRDVPWTHIDLDERKSSSLTFETNEICKLKLAEKYQRSAGILILQDAQSEKKTKQIAYENSKRLWHQWYISRIDS